jgi:hypothetical protein
VWPLYLDFTKTSSTAVNSTISAALVTFSPRFVTHFTEGIFIAGRIL